MAPSQADASPSGGCGLQKQGEQGGMKMCVSGLLGPKTYLQSTEFTVKKGLCFFKQKWANPRYSLYMQTSFPTVMKGHSKL